MREYNNLYDFILSNLTTFFYPEDWLDLDLNFSKTELLTLFVVERHGEVSMSQICEAMNMPMSTATGIIDRLVKKGLLQRERSETDRRLVVVSLTEQGRAIISHWKEVVVSIIDQVEAVLTQEERQLLFKVVTKLMDILSRRGNIAGTQEPGPVIKKIEID